MTFRLGITRDLLTSDGSPSFGLGPLELLKQEQHIDWEFIDETVAEITPDIMARYDGLHVNSPAVTARSVARADCRVRLVSRHGVGFDSVDVAALATGVAMLFPMITATGRRINSATRTGSRSI